MIRPATGSTNGASLLGLLALVLLLFSLAPAGSAVGASQDDFSTGNLNGWRVRDGEWSVAEGRAVAQGGFAVLLHPERQRDCEITADVAYSHPEPQAAAGILFRYREDGTGYAAGLREVEKGVHPEYGPWERPVLQLYRWDRDGWKLLQESKVMGCRSDLLRRLKVVCRGPNIWVFYEDMETPTLSEYDPEYDREGQIGLWKDLSGRGLYDNFRIAPVGTTPPPPGRTDWSGVRGAVYIRSNAVNSAQMWHDYWEHAALLDRELSYAAAYGFNLVQVYLHWTVWDRHQGEYLKRIDDFLTRASRHGLQVNLIFWDDCGHVEPSLAFADPVPGRHNSQMMPNPSHRIRGSEAELTAHRERFRAYVQGVAARFKDDPRIAFWQLYNEAMGPKEQYRDGVADANLNRLLGWTREWVKATGTSLPVTATGGGFYGPKYSDFYSYHSYRSAGGAFPHADGGPEHLCTETLNRPDAGLIDCLQGLAGKKNGFVVWELMIGRDNCRYPWGHPDGPAEPAQPFHGAVFPDGHPWDLREVEALLGAAGYAALRSRTFDVEYFDGEFKTSRKKSITPCIDFDLGDEPGSGSPDSAVGLGKDHFAVRWTGNLAVPATGTYEFTVDGDGVTRLWLGDQLVIGKEDLARREIRGTIRLKAGEVYPVKIEYVHSTGPASEHVFWSGPGLKKRPFQLGTEERLEKERRR